MITICLTYRNRDLSILKRCLNSLKEQTQKNFEVVLVNYGSNKEYTNSLSKIVADYTFLKIIHCKTDGQLWCKSKAINIALKQCDNSHFFVGDVDMIYHPEFIDTLETLIDNAITYFKVGFLSEAESSATKSFEDYEIKFNSDEGATGITLYKTEILKSVNGYDEFYHGWGSEDTDVHIRLKNAGHKIVYYDTKILMLHQWHAKIYRTKDSIEPFHSNLEQINAEYLRFVHDANKVKANVDNHWGDYSGSDYDKLQVIDSDFKISNKQAEVKAFIQAVLFGIKNKVIRLSVNEHSEYNSVKQFVKGKIGKKTIAYLPMDEVNDLLLESIISNLNHCAYIYEFDRTTNQIDLTIML